MRIQPFVVAVSFLLLSCAHSPIHGAVPDGQRPGYVAKIWVEDAPGMPAGLILEGCALWAPLGIGCQLVRDRAMADLRFVAVRTPCVASPPPPKGDGLRTLALAHADRHVEMFVNCFTDTDGKIDEEKIRTVAGHEIGHELGIWDHVPLSCDDRDEKYVLLKGGDKLCGQAVMNPQYADDVLELTDMDGHAFEHRHRDQSIYRPTSDDGVTTGADDVICTYRTGGKE